MIYSRFQLFRDGYPFRSHKGDLAVLDIQEWIIFHGEKIFFLEDGKKGCPGEDGNKNALSSITCLFYCK